MSNIETLALLGGKPMREEKLPHYNTIGEAEKREVMNVLESGELSGFIAYDGKEFYGGKQVQALEAAFRDYFKSPYAVSVNSATSGLHVALAAMEIGPGDEVIVPPYTMSASATCVLFTGAVPIFADIEDETFGLDPKEVEKNISPYTKGIVAVNLFGHPARLMELRKIADKHGLFLIEDNAQAPAAKCEGHYTGTIGDAGVFSFNRHKTMQSGEGGMVLCKDEKIALKMQLVRNHGEVVVAAKGVTDIVNTAGLNYRMSEMEAAVARHQFAKIDDLNAIRVELANRITKNLEEIDGISAPVIRDNCTHAFYFYVMKYDEDVVGIPRKLFMEAINAEGFTLRAGYVKPLYREPLYKNKICFGKNGFPFTANPRNDEIQYKEGLCPVVERLNDEEIILTNIIYPPLTVEDMDKFTDSMKKVIRNKDALLEYHSKRAA